MPSRSCKSGQIRRKAYTRKSGVRVKSSCVKDVGKRGKGKSVIKIKHRGSLKKYGYNDVAHKSVDARHRSLRKAVKAYGSTKVIRKLNAVAVLTKNTNRKLSAKFNADKKFVMRLGRK